MFELQPTLCKTSYAHEPGLRVNALPSRDQESTKGLRHCGWQKWRRAVRLSRGRSFSGPDGRIRGRRAALLDFEHFEVGPRHVFEPSEGRLEIGSHQRRLPLSLDRPCSLPPSLAQIRCWMIGRTTPRPRYGSRQRPRPVMKIMPYLGMSSRHGLCQLHLEYLKMIRPYINSDRRGIFVEYFEVAWLLPCTMVITAV